MVGPVMSHLRAVVRILARRVHALWRRFRRLSPRMQILTTALVILLVIVFFAVVRNTESTASVSANRTVTLESIGALGGAHGSSTVLGTVRSITEAEVLAETSGTVRSVHTRIGAEVPSGFIIAELENASERAAVLQAEGAYDAAVAAQSATSLTDVRTTAENVYRDAFSDFENVLENGVDLFFGGPTVYGPDLLINPGSVDGIYLSQERASIDRAMDQWRKELSSISERDPAVFLTEAETLARTIESFGNTLAEAAYKSNSRATTEQLAAFASARSTISGILASLTNARTLYRSGATTSTASTEAGVKSALGTLRLAQATLEKTLIRAPIGGTINFLPMRVGMYVTGLSHVATVAQNGALEVTAFVSEDERDLLAVDMQVSLGEGATGTVTSIAPALDPVTKRIEVRITANAESGITNGQSVRVGIPSSTLETVTGTFLLPLTSVKLRASDRVVFSVDEQSRLVAHAVTLGEVRGDRVEVQTDLSPLLRIVTDARGLAEGETVSVQEVLP